MKVEVTIIKDIKESRVIIETDNITTEIQHIIDFVSQTSTPMIMAYSGTRIARINYQDVYLVESKDQAVWIHTNEGVFKIKHRLYEIETMFSHLGLIRISNSEIVNMQQVKRFDMSLRGTIIVLLKNNHTCFASRRYVNQIKKFLKKEVNHHEKNND